MRMAMNTEGGEHPRPSLQMQLPWPESVRGPRDLLPNFSNLGTLQAIDKPGFLSLVLAEHSEFLARRDIDIGSLSNDDACARQLLAVFAQGDALPGSLLQAFHVLEALANGHGHDRILAEAARCGIGLGDIPALLSPVDFAIAVWREHPHLIRVSYENTVCEKTSRYHEFRSRDARRLRLESVKASLPELEESLGAWFEAQRRSCVCQIFTYEQGNEIRCLVTHGDPYRTDGSITPTLERSRIGYRPQRHDSLLYDRQTGILRIHARFQAQRLAYRETLGRVLFNDAGYFRECPTYTLEPLRSGGGVLTLVSGMTEVQVTEACIEQGVDGISRQTLKGSDLLEMLAGRGSADVAGGRIVRAHFSIKYESGGRARTLRVSLPNVAEYDRERDGAVVDAFLRMNHLVAVTSDDIEPGPLVAAA